MNNYNVRLSLSIEGLYIFSIKAESKEEAKKQMFDTIKKNIEYYINIEVEEDD